MPYFHNNHTRLYYEVHGVGAPLVLISGMGGDLSFWSGSVARLQDHFQVIIFDNRGIGRSDTPLEPYSMELFADDLACLLDHLELESSHVLGFSMGGNIAQAFALKYPHRLQKLIIAASYAKMNRQAELFLDAVLAVYENGASAKQMFNLILPWLFSADFLSRPENEGYLEFDENDPFEQPLHAFRNQYLAQKAADSRSNLNKIQAETLIIAGEKDALVLVEDARVLIQGIENSNLRVISDAGHLFNLEKPEMFHSEILNFLSDETG